MYKTKYTETEQEKAKREAEAREELNNAVIKQLVKMQAGKYQPLKVQVSNG